MTSAPESRGGPSGELILAVESSCDETAAAVIRNGREVLANVVHSQVAEHRPYGGVVPELAARAHLERVGPVMDLALDRAGIELGDVDLLAVTTGPGLVGCLLVGVAAIEGVASATGSPVVGVNHLAGHVYSAFLAQPDLEPPLLALVASGGHADLVLLRAHDEYEVLGGTRDDAPGEAFDKAARLLGLGYPGGPALDRAARTGDPERQRFPRTRLDGLDYSFSGLKTALLYRLRDLGAAGKPDTLEPQLRSDLSAGFEGAVAAQLVAKLSAAAAETGCRNLAIVGGVSANTGLRDLATRTFRDSHRLVLPPLDLCTDNAAMIGAAASAQYARRGPTGFPLVADPALELGGGHLST